MNNKRNFIKHIQIWGVALIVGVAVSITIIDIFESYRDLKKTSSQVRLNYISTQKQIVKEEVERVASLISYEKSQSELLTKQRIKSRVYEAISIAENIYKQNRIFRGQDEIKKMILEVLGAIRFAEGSGYYFVTQLDGVEVLFANRQKLKGVNLLELRDSGDKYVAQNRMASVKETGEGFYEYLSTKPQSPENHHKIISFGKLFTPFEWVIGTSLYVEDIEKEIEANLLSRISRIRFGKEGYIFVNRLNGDALVSNGKIFSGTKKLWEEFDSNPSKMREIFEKEYEAALNPGGDYIQYTHIKLSDEKKESLKTSFILGISELQWLIGAGVYFDDIEKDIVLMQANLKEQILEKIFFSFIILIAVLAFFLFIFDRLSLRLKNDTNVLVQFFKKAAFSNEAIDRSQIYFDVSDHMAENANKMLADKIRAEKQLIMFRTFAESSNQGMGWADSEGKIQYVNAALVTLLGERNAEATLGKNVLTAYYPIEEQQRLIDEIFPQVLEHGEWAGELKLQQVNGDLIPTHNSLFLISDKTSQEGLFVANIVNDITDRKQAEEALLASEKRFKDLTENSTDWIWEFDENEIFTYSSPRIKDLLGYTPEEIVGRSAFDPISSPEVEKVMNEFLQFKNARKPFSALQNVNKHQNGGEVIIESSGVPIFDNEGNFRGYRGIDRDITQRVKLERQLRQAYKMEAIGTLAGGIAHDFNNILSSIIGYSELARASLPESLPAREDINEVLKAGDRAKELVQHILSFSRMDKSEPAPVRVDLIANETLKLIRASIPTTIEIREKINSKCGYIKANPTQIHQILMNLCTNASHAMDEKGGVLSLTVEKIRLEKKDLGKRLDGKKLSPGNYIKTSVCDTGHGIPPHLLSKIFDPYFTTKEIGEGSGMGLAVVHGIVESWNGFIEVESQVEKGTCFRIYFPECIQIETHDLPVSHEDIDLPHGTESILFVDDEQSIVVMNEHRLKLLGYNVTATKQSREALDLFKARPDYFDMVITDQTMPQLTGDQLARELLSIRPDIPVILCTGYSSKVSEDQVRAMGIKALVMKPIPYQELAETIRNILDKS